MEFVSRSNGFYGDIITYRWRLDELQSRKACIDFMLEVTDWYRLDRVECWESFVAVKDPQVFTFTSKQEFVDKAEELATRHLDEITLYWYINNEIAGVHIVPCWNKAEGNYLSVFGQDYAVKEISQKIARLLSDKTFSDGDAP